MKKLLLKIMSSVLISIRTGSIFAEDNIGVFIVKATFLLAFIVIVYLLITSKRTKKFLRDVRKFW